jgi:protease IV
MEISKESIFISGIRSFVKGFLAVFGSLISLVLVVFIISLFTLGQENKNTINILPDLAGNDKILPTTAPVILKLSIQGEIGKDNLTQDIVISQLMQSRKDVLKNDRVKAIFLYINSPGGTVNDSDIIYRCLLDYKNKYKTPIYAYVDGLCASGGFYIAAAADKIYSSPVSIIGSVGVIMGPFFNVNQLLNKWGIQSLTLTEGKNKDMMNPFRPWKEKEEASLKDLSSYFYNRFVDIVTLNRKKLDKEKLINDYGALVFNPEKAEKLGFIDKANVSLEDAFLDLLKMAKIDEKSPYQVIELAPKPRLLDSLINSSSLDALKLIKEFLHINPKNSSSPIDNFYYMYQPNLK